MISIKWSAKRAPHAAEKVVTPAIIFINSWHPKFHEYEKLGLHGFGLYAGWWDWSVGVRVYWGFPKATTQ